MNIEEMINSDDIEVAELGCNIMLQNGSDLKLIKKNCRYRLILEYNKIKLFKDWNDVTFFVRDPTRTVLIEIP